MGRWCGFWGVALVGGVFVSLVAVVIAPRFVGHARADASISAEAAEKAAEERFYRSMGCGFVEGPARDLGNYWAFNARVGIAGKLDPEPILVDKRTGVATWATHEPETKSGH